uniref:Uncharacterized protein n=1 Tax=Arundo donax TaxID=35708 RepID=A0A0A9GXR4_ARUDO
MFGFLKENNSQQHFLQGIRRIVDCISIRPIGCQGM